MIKKLLSYLLVLVGNAICAAVFGLIVLPQEFAAGGVTGLSMLLHRVIPLPVSVLVLAVNLALFAMGWIFVGKEFVLKSLLSSLSFPLLLELFQSTDLLAPLAADPLLSCAIAGAALGLGSALVLLNDGSGGGFDIIGVVLNRKFRIPISPVMYLLDAAVILGHAVSTGLLQTTYGILMILVAGVVTNHLLVRGNASGEMFIFSREYEAIREELLFRQDVGMTFLHGETGYCREPIQVILTVIPFQKFEAVKRRVYEIDPTAFVLMENIRYVGGRGYTLDRH